MGWQVAARFIKTDKPDQAKQYIANARKHWEEVALDTGFDPAKNVQLKESDNEVALLISDEIDQYFRESAGTWRFDIPGDVSE